MAHRTPALIGVLRRFGMLTYLAAGLALSVAGSRAQERVAGGTADRGVLILSPYMVFEKLQDESPLDPDKFGRLELEKELSATVEQYLRSKGFRILAATNYPPEVTVSIGNLQPASGRVARGSVTAGSRAALTDLALKLGPVVILAQYLRVRVGGKGWWWNPLNGAIASGQAETLLAAALIDPASGSAVWKNEILVRKVLLPDSKNLKEALNTLYATLQ